MKEYPKRRYLLTGLTILSMLAGFVIARGGLAILATTFSSLSAGDSIAGHALEFLIMGLVATAIGMVPLGAGVYAFIATKGFRRWEVVFPGAFAL